MRADTDVRSSRLPRLEGLFGDDNELSDLVLESTSSLPEGAADAAGLIIRALMG